MSISFQSRFFGVLKTNIVDKKLPETPEPGFSSPPVAVKLSGFAFGAANFTS
jgi:hypothetical protein